MLKFESLNKRSSIEVSFMMFLTFGHLSRYFALLLRFQLTQGPLLSFVLMETYHVGVRMKTIT